MVLSWPLQLGQEKPPLILSQTHLWYQPPKPTLSVLVWWKSCPWWGHSAAENADLDNSHERSPHQQTQMGMGRAKVGAVSTYREYLGLVCQVAAAAAVGLVWPF